MLVFFAFLVRSIRPTDKGVTVTIADFIFAISRESIWQRSFGTADDTITDAMFLGFQARWQCVSDFLEYVSRESRSTMEKIRIQFDQDIAQR